jgi:hypothetical protein
MELPLYHQILAVAVFVIGRALLNHSITNKEMSLTSFTLQ